jgi:hypothetical protein
MNVIFTDIDGVFNTINRNQWSSLSVALYDDLCQEFNLKPVITSTWRVKHSIKELERIFQHYGIFTDIYDFTPIINSEGRGGEIENWLKENQCDNYLILDDNVRDIESYGLKNIVKCRSWIGFTKEEYDICRNILLNE